MALTPAVAFPLALALRLAAVIVVIGLRRRRETARRFVFGAAAAASVLSGIVAVAVLAGHPDIHGPLWLHPASGLTLEYAIDGLSAWFLLVLSAVAAPIAVFSIGYARAHPLDERSVFFGAAFNVLVGAVEVLFVAADVLTFLFAWELMTLATAALVATEHEQRVARRAAYLYLVMSHVGTGLLIAAFFTLASASGSLSFSQQLAGTVLSGGTRDVVFVLFFAGFGVKAGIIPLHIWLPEAHPAAPSSISALMSGVLIKTGIYGLMRFGAFGLGVPALSWGVVVLTVGGLSAVLGVLYALMQHDLKRLLAYHSIENIGIILLGLGAGMMALSSGHPALAAVGVASALYHVLNHAVFKGLLFLGAGSVVAATHTRQIEELGGLLRRMPWTGACFLLGALAISGLPPLNGFASEWLAFQALLYGFKASAEPLVHFLFPVAGALLALTGALAAACFVKAFGITFLARPRSEAAAAATEVPRAMLWPQVFLAISCVVLGLVPGSIVSTLQAVMASMHGMQPGVELARGSLAMSATDPAATPIVPAVLAVAIATALAAATAVAFLTRAARGRRRLVPTWGCGGLLTASAEYTATAFSKPLMMIFRAIYRPTREVEALAKVSPYFPQEIRYHVEIEPTFERYLYEPFANGVYRLAERLKILQAGSLHAYLGYVIVLVLSLVLFVWWNR